MKNFKGWIVETNLVKILGVKGITLFPFIFIKKGLRDDKKLINHERIHIQQELECFVIPFYIMYLWEYIKKGYRKISFEREAFDNDENLKYLRDRKRCAWKKYLK